MVFSPHGFVPGAVGFHVFRENKVEAPSCIVVAAVDSFRCYLPCWFSFVIRMRQHCLDCICQEMRFRVACLLIVRCSDILLARVKFGCCKQLEWHVPYPM